MSSRRRFRSPAALRRGRAPGYVAHTHPRDVFHRLRVIRISARQATGTVVVYSISEGPEPLITFKVETEQEDDGRWLAEVIELPGVLAYGDTQEAALSKIQALALRVVAERLEHGEAGPELLSICFNAA